MSFLKFRTSIEDSSHSTPSPMSSAASSQDSLQHPRNMLGNTGENPYGNPYLMVGNSPHMSAAQVAAAKKKSNVHFHIRCIYPYCVKEIK